MNGGFEHEITQIGPGWQHIVREMHEKVLQIDPEIEVVQIKEKFGGLRYYYVSKAKYQSAESNAITELVAAAETKCEITCEDCGKPGENKSVGGWFRTLCEECREKALERRKAMRKEYSEQPGDDWCPCGHPPDDHEDGKCMHLCDCAWPDETSAGQITPGGSNGGIPE